MDRVFQIVAVILAAIAAYFLWAGKNDEAFVSTVLGLVAFFLNIRFQVKARNRLREEERNREGEDGPEPPAEAGSSDAGR